MELYAPRWNVLKVNIEHSQSLLNCARAIGSHEMAAIHKRSIFHKQEELKRYDFMWDRTASSEEKQEIIKLLK